MNVCHRLEDYLDAELTPDAARGFRAHLEFCEECRDAVETHATFVGLVGDAKKAFDTQAFSLLPEMPSTVTTDIAKPIAKPSFGQWAFSIAASIVILVAAWSVFRPAPKSTEVASSENSPLADGGSRVPKAVSSIVDDQPLIVTDDRHVAEPIATGDPEITIYWLHSTVLANDDESSSLTSPDSSHLPNEKHQFLVRGL